MLAMMSGLFFYHRSEKMTQDKFCIFGFDHSSNPHASQLQYGFKVTRVCVNFDQCWDVSPLEVGLAPKESLTFFFPSWVLSSRLNVRVQFINFFTFMCRVQVQMERTRNTAS